ncbi:hypothetical protein AVEN_182819-1 [Araneus ventricosus]|uniref:Uncharacterized protein n=1 Tax=Araneus ventricosus TaxID=182803 RepID=A0A4Y2S309_ARAVE|nr:hypothetical protein AVEN_182819-1 [Araneus ventricosus]
MEIPNIVACIAIIPWAWIMMKLAVFGDLINLMPMAIFGYLIYLLDRAIRNQNLAEIMAKQDQQLKKRDSFSQTEICQLAEKSTQTKREKVDAITQVETSQFRETSTQTIQMKIDASTHMDCKEYSVKSTQTNCTILEEKEVQTYREKPKKLKLKLRPTRFWRKRVQMKPKSSKAPVPSKERYPEPTIPTTDEFMNYHKEKHAYLRRKIKFSPKLNEIPEADEDIYEPEMCNLPIDDELGPEPSIFGENTVGRNGCKMILQSLDTNTDDVKRLEARKKQSELTFWKKKFKKLKKTFKK